MSLRKKTIFIFLIIIVLIGFSFISGYNSLVEADETVSQNESQVIIRLNQRQAQIDQLLPTVIGLQNHAEEIYNKITSARAAYSTARNTGDIEGMIAADAEEATAINQLLIVIEDNPDIQATPAFLNLMDTISGMESAIAQARKDYNDSVALYNKSVKKIPKIFYASMLGFDREKPYWRMNDGADEIPQINFNNN